MAKKDEKNVEAHPNDTPELEDALRSIRSTGEDTVGEEQLDDQAETK